MGRAVKYGQGLSARKAITNPLSAAALFQAMRRKKRVR